MGVDISAERRDLPNRTRPLSPPAADAEARWSKGGKRNSATN